MLCLWAETHAKGILVKIMEFVLTTPIGHRLQMISSIDAYAKAPGFQDIIVRKTLPLLQRGKTAAQLIVSG